MQFLRKDILFVGNKDRLQRFVKRENGKFLDHQKFTVVFKSSKIRRKYRPIPFCFHCTYEKEKNGYSITYYVVPSTTGSIIILLEWAFLFFITWWQHWNPLIILVVFIFALPNYLSERSDCIRQFEAACQK